MSEKIKIQCPGCSATLKITEKHFGKSFNCPSCQVEIRVRAAEPSEPAQQPIDLAAFSEPRPEQTRPLAPPKPMPTPPTEPNAGSYWKAAGSATQPQKFQPQSRAEKFKAANQRKKKKQEEDSEFGALFRVGGFMVILGLAGAVLPFVGLELKVGGPLVALFIGLVGCVLIAIALREQLVVAIGSAIGGAAILCVFCITSHYINYVDPNPVAQPQRPNAVAQNQNNNQQQNNRPPQNQLQNQNANNQPQKSRIERLIDDSSNRAALTLNPFRDLVAKTSNSANPTTNALTQNSTAPDNPFGNFAQPVDTTPAHSIPKSTESENTDSDPFAVDEPQKNAFGSIESDDTQTTQPDKKDIGNPFSVVESDDTAGDEANPFKVDPPDMKSATDEENPFQVQNPNDSSNSNRSPSLAGPRVVSKMTQKEEEELWEGRYRDGTQLERGKSLNGSLSGGLSMTQPVGKIQLIGKAMYDNRPVVGVALGKAVGRTMVYPIYEGDKQFSNEVRAPQGAYLAGLHIGFEEGALTGVQAVFANRSGRGLNMQSTVESEWLGKKPRRSLMKRLYSKDGMVHGITVFQKAASIWGVGLVVD